MRIFSFIISRNWTAKGKLTGKWKIRHALTGSKLPRVYDENKSSETPVSPLPKILVTILYPPPFFRFRLGKPERMNRMPFHRLCLWKKIPPLPNPPQSLLLRTAISILVRILRLSINALALCFLLLGGCCSTGLSL